MSDIGRNSGVRKGVGYFERKFQGKWEGRPPATVGVSKLELGYHVAWLWSRDCFKIFPFVVMQRVARVCLRQLSYLFCRIVVMVQAIENPLECRPILCEVPDSGHSLDRRLYVSDVFQLHKQICLCTLHFTAHAQIRPFISFR